MPVPNPQRQNGPPAKQVPQDESLEAIGQRVDVLEDKYHRTNRKLTLAHAHAQGADFLKARTMCSYGQWKEFCRNRRVKQRMINNYIRFKLKVATVATFTEEEQWSIWQRITRGNVMKKVPRDRHDADYTHEYVMSSVEQCMVASDCRFQDEDISRFLEELESYLSQNSDTTQREDGI